jgi:hypothetical protein
MTSIKKKILVVDIGSHKAQEVKLIGNTPKIRLSYIYKLFKRCRYSLIGLKREIRNTRHYARCLSNDFEFRLHLNRTNSS